jgi:hypothetical protein
MLPHRPTIIHVILRGSHPSGWWKQVFTRKLWWVTSPSPQGNSKQSDRYHASSITQFLVLFTTKVTLVHPPSSLKVYVILLITLSHPPHIMNVTTKDLYSGYYWVQTLISVMGSMFILVFHGSLILLRTKKNSIFEIK